MKRMIIRSVAGRVSLYVVVALAGGLFLSACNKRPVKQAEGKVRVGTYDSRAIVAAYFFGQFYEQDKAKQMKAAEEEVKKAKATGDKKQIAEAEAKLNNVAPKMQNVRHKQFFSTAPVDDILVHIQDQMQGIAKEAGVVRIVSKWDKKVLAEYKGAETVDVTMEMVKAFHPSEKQLQMAIEIQTKEPIPLEEAEKMDWSKE